MTAMASARDVVDGVLDTLAVTDRVYHDLKHDAPLVEELVARVRFLRTGGRVLVVGPNALLADVLIDLGYEVEIWRHPQTILTDRGMDSVRRSGSLESLLAGDRWSERFDLVVMPYVIEAAREQPAELLTRVRQLLAPGGCLVVAFRAAGALHYRLAALGGESVPPDLPIDSRAASYGWPPYPARRAFGPAELREWGMQTGFRVEGARRILDRRPFVAVHALSLQAWLKAKASQAVKQLIPAVRDCVVTQMTPYAEGERVDVRGFEPLVTVIMAASHRAYATQALERMAVQTYPNERIEVLVVGPAELHDLQTSGRFSVRYIVAPGFGPRAANLALHHAVGEIVAFTDDRCAVASDWVDVGVGSLADSAAASTGPVRADSGSALPFLALPGARPTESPEGWFSLANSFYVRAAAINAGGFDERFERDGRVGVAWDHELARRLDRRGYRTRVESRLVVRRVFPYPRARSWFGEEFHRASTLPAAAGMRPQLVSPVLGIFAASRTFTFDLVLAGIALTPFVGPLSLGLTLPWLISIRQFLPVWPPFRARTAARNLRGLLLRHAIWLAGLVHGSIRAKRILL